MTSHERSQTLAIKLLRKLSSIQEGNKFYKIKKIYKAGEEDLGVMWLSKEAPMGEFAQRLKVDENTILCTLHISRTSDTAINMTDSFLRETFIPVK